MKIQNLLQAYLGTSQDFRRISIKTVGRRNLGYGFLTGCIMDIKASSCMLFGKRQTYLVELIRICMLFGSLWRRIHSLNIMKIDRLDQLIGHDPPDTTMISIRGTRMPSPFSMFLKTDFLDFLCFVAAQLLADL